MINLITVAITFLFIVALYRSFKLRGFKKTILTVLTTYVVIKLSVVIREIVNLGQVVDFIIFAFFMYVALKIVDVIDEHVEKDGE